MFAGAHTALVTPFRNGQPDEAAFTALVEGQIAGGITGIVPVGTTGESPTLSHDEHLRVIELAVKVAAGRCLVIAGTGSNATDEAIQYTQAAEQLGADAALIVAPYYNKPSQEGIFRHFRAIAAATRLPIVLYSIKGRCGVSIEVETVARLARECPNIVAIKEAEGDVERVRALRQKVRAGEMPAAFEILSGDDSRTLPFIEAGAVGVISVASNIIPQEVGELVRAALAGVASGSLDVARALHEKWAPLFRDLFIEPNPVPVKTALAWQGRMEPDVRLPLCEMSAANAEKLRGTLTQLGLI